MVGQLSLSGLAYKTLALIILFILVYLVLDDGLYHRIIYDKDNRWILNIHRKYIPQDHFDKYGHFIMSGLIALFLNIFLSSKMISFKRLNILLGSLIVGILFTLMEIYHLFVPHRNFELLDLFFTYAGIFVLGGLSFWISQLRHTLNNTHKT